MHNPYSEGMIAAGAPNSHVEDCPYRTPLMWREREEWLRGFSSVKVPATIKPVVKA